MSGRGLLWLCDNGPMSASPAQETAPSTIRAMRRSFVLHEHKIVYIQLGKNGSTSLKWLFADLTEQDPARFLHTDLPKPTRRQCIHHRRLWKGVPLLRELDESERAEISPDNGWFVFAVVRDPRVRTWSAWQSKLLVRPPRWTESYSDTPWFPRVPEGPADIVEDFATFVRYLREERHSPIATDQHFRPQTVDLHEDQVPYSRIYDISEFPVLLDDLAAHLRTVGDYDLPPLKKDNDTPLGPRPEVFDGSVREDLEAIYAEDLERFGHHWDLDATLARPAVWTDDVFGDIAQRVAMHERISDMSTDLLAYKDADADLRTQVKGLKRDVRRLERKLSRAREAAATPQAPSARSRPGAALARLKQRLG